VTYTANFPETELNVNDIRNIDVNSIPDFDVMLAGFPCQPFSQAGLRQGFDDEKGRGNLVFDLIRIAKQKKPKVLFFENVKNLKNHDEGKTLKTIISVLEKELGYFVINKVFNTCEYTNIPQNRERIIIIAFKNKVDFEKFEWIEPIKLENKIHDFIDFENEQDEKYYYKDKKYKILYEKVMSSSTVFMWRRADCVRENKKNMCPCLLASMGEGGNNVPIIKTFGGDIRKLTERECFNLQGFPQDFILPKNLSSCSLYKQAGNSVTVNLIKRLAKKILQTIDCTN